MVNTISIIICTYNRPHLVESLVNQLKEFQGQFAEIIVVDSSDLDNVSLAQDGQVIYLKSSRKSQPYQRFIGAEKSSSSLLVFFDDDIKIIDTDLFLDILKAFEQKEIVGVSAGIHYENGIELNQTEKVSHLPYTGKISWLGKTTGLPKENAFVEYFPGPIMVFRKAICNNLFDEYLFSLFEKRIAMGEDKVISMRASEHGKLYFLGAKTYLHHPPEPSTYFNNEKDFIAKTVFSRLWLSKEYAKAHGKYQISAYLYFFLYFSKNYLINLIKYNKTRLKGMNQSVTYLLQNKTSTKK